MVERTIVYTDVTSVFRSYAFQVCLARPHSHACKVQHHGNLLCPATGSISVVVVLHVISFKCGCTSISYWSAASVYVNYFPNPPTYGYSSESHNSKR